MGLDYGNFYKNKKVLITGHTGFKGAWLLKSLTMLGANVMGVALINEDKNHIYNLIDGDNLCESRIFDIRNSSKMDKVIKSFNPEIIFHLAAQPLVIESYSNPLETFDVNIIGTVNLFTSLLRTQHNCAVINITTDKVYENFEWEYPYRESDRLGGHDPYSSSKACSEIVSSSFLKSFENFRKYGLSTVRAGNVIGGGDWSKNRLIPDIVKSLISGKDIIIRNPLSVRPWQHVMEAIVGYLELGIRLIDNPSKYSQSFNFGPNINNTLSVKDLASKFVSVWGSGKLEINGDLLNLHEAKLLKLDISKTISYLDWKPKLNSEESVILTADWYKSFCQNDDIIKTTEKQINTFIYE